MWPIIILGVLILLLIVVVILLCLPIWNEKPSKRRDKLVFKPTADMAGFYGEEVTKSHLKKLLKEDEFLLNNILLPLKNGHKTEIDSILITHKGIFCIETKNWVGHISGKDEDEYWYQDYDDPSKGFREHKNPVKQNEHHCEILEKHLGNSFSIDNIVIFIDLEDGSNIDSNCAFSLEEFKNYYSSLNNDELSTSEINQIYERLRLYIASDIQLKEHCEDIQKRFNTQ